MEETFRAAAPNRGHRAVAELVRRGTAAAVITVVYPAAGFPELAKHNGATLVIINREPTGLDGIADLVLNRSIGETLGAAVGVD